MDSAPGDELRALNALNQRRLFVCVGDDLVFFHVANSSRMIKLIDGRCECGHLWVVELRSVSSANTPEWTLVVTSNGKSI